MLVHTKPKNATFPAVPEPATSFSQVMYNIATSNARYGGTNDTRGTDMISMHDDHAADTPATPW
jgi:hypothetical protein